MLTRRPFLMTFANPGTAVVARRHDAFAVFEAFDVVAPDGIAMVKAIHWQHRQPAARISFDSTSLALPVMQLAVRHASRVVLVGGGEGVAAHAGRQLCENFRGLNIVGTVHGFHDMATLVQMTRELQPEIVICGMGGLLQDRFLLALRETGWTGVGFTCGGYLDQLSKGLQYYPWLVDTLNLRFAYRLVKEPRRLWRRYLLDYPIFAMSLCRGMTYQRADEHRRHS